MMQGHPKIQVSVVGTTSRLSLCHQVAAPVQGPVFVPGLAHPDLPPRPGACDLWPGGSLGCAETPGAELWYLAESQGEAKLWPLPLQHGMELKAAQAEGLMVRSGVTS